MNKREAKRIIRHENLKVNLFLNHEIRPYEMVIEKKGDHYEVFGTDERASIWGVASRFTNEEEALDDVIKRARIKI